MQVIFKKKMDYIKLLQRLDEQLRHWEKINRTVESDGSDPGLEEWCRVREVADKAYLKARKKNWDHPIVESYRKFLKKERIANVNGGYYEFGLGFRDADLEGLTTKP